MYLEKLELSAYEIQTSADAIIYFDSTSESPKSSKTKEELICHFALTNIIIACKQCINIVKFPSL